MQFHAFCAWSMKSMYLEDGLGDRICVTQVLCLGELPPTEGLLQEASHPPSVYSPWRPLLHCLHTGKLERGSGKGLQPPGIHASMASANPASLVDGVCASRLDMFLLACQSERPTSAGLY